MRPIPAPRLGDTHGLLRAISSRDRVRLDEFITEFSIEELFPPGLENALGRTRQFVSFARSAGLLKEDRGVVELTEIGKRYVKSADPQRFFDVSSGQAEWLRRQLREKHMTDSIYHGAAIGLSLLASSPPDFRVSTLDFGRALAYLARAGWDNENTFTSQGERYAVFLTDLELIDQDPDDPFDFSAPRYNDMLVAGYSRNTASKGLKTYMPDYDDLKAGRPVAHTPGESRRMVQGASR